MGRPADWAPLGCGSDPVPGDPGAVSAEAAHLAGVARQVSGQVAALRRIAATADGGSLRGVFAARAGICAADVAGQLAQVAGRYEKASAALAAWAPELAHAQAVSLRALAGLLALQNADGSQGLAHAVATSWTMLAPARRRGLIGAALAA